MKLCMHVDRSARQGAGDVNCSRFPRRDEDVFCPFCGSLTTYELERQKGL